MKPILILACIFMALTTRGADELLIQLDQLVSQRPDGDQNHHEIINRGWTDFYNSENAEQQYNALRGLYEQYRSYKIDSALTVADMRLTLARRLGDGSKTTSASLNLAEAYVRSGAPDKTIAILDTINEANIRDYHVKYRNSIYRSAYELKAETSLLTGDRLEALDKLKKYRDNVDANNTYTSRSSYIIEAERLRDAGLVNEALAKIEEANDRFDFGSDAAMLYTMGDFYLSAGRRDEAVDCLARSAIIDLSNGTKEYRSLILLASTLHDMGDIERSFRYINCAFDDATFSHAAIRLSEIMKCMPVIDNAFHNAQQEIAGRNRSLLIISACAALLLLLALFVAIKAYRSKRAMVKRIEQFNLTLEEKNRELKKADALKLSHINALMMSHADYISQLRNFRRSVARLMRASQYEKALDLVNDKAETSDIALFNEMFDRSFLSMFPNFVADINKVMKYPVELKSSERLTPELRIAAIMRIGITTTDDISKMFHYSSQTVYNLRSSLRNALNMTWEEFETYLSTI